MTEGIFLILVLKERTIIPHNHFSRFVKTH
jgi:hypothetical protein